MSADRVKKFNPIPDILYSWTVPLLLLAASLIGVVVAAILGGWPIALIAVLPVFIALTTFMSEEKPFLRTRYVMEFPYEDYTRVANYLNEHEPVARFTSHAWQSITVEFPFEDEYIKARLYL